MPKSRLRELQEKFKQKFHWLTPIQVIGRKITIKCGRCHSKTEIQSNHMKTWLSKKKDRCDNCWNKKLKLRKNEGLSAKAGVTRSRVEYKDRGIVKDRHILRKGNTSILRIKLDELDDREWKQIQLIGKAETKSGIKFSLQLSKPCVVRTVEWKKIDNLKYEDWQRKLRRVNYPGRNLVIAIDPGVVNSAFSVFDVNQNITLLDRGMFHNLMTSLTSMDISDSRSQFQQEFGKLLESARHKYNYVGPIHLVIERFMPRGYKQTTIELVNIMIGQMLTVHSVLSLSGLVRVITPSQWKNAFNRKFDLEKSYMKAKKCGLTPHELDSTLIGRYGIHQWFGYEFDPNKLHKGIK